MEGSYICGDCRQRVTAKHFKRTPNDRFLCGKTGQITAVRKLTAEEIEKYRSRVRRPRDVVGLKRYYEASRFDSSRKSETQKLREALSR